jgi:hypothetical protein
LSAGAATERAAAPVYDLTATEHEAAVAASDLKESKMDTNKAWYLSKTIWGGAMALLAGVLNLQGDDVQAVSEMVSAGSNHVAALISIVGGLLAIYGRVKAASKIGG